MIVLEELRRLPDERFLSLYEALGEKGFGPLDAEVARALKFRPQAIRKLPLEKRARHARRLMLSRKNAELCYEFFGAYLVREHKELVTRFLDGTGVPHEEGMIEDISKTPAPEKIEGVVRELDAEFDPEDVTMYLALCAEQWSEVEELRRMWEERRGVGAEG